MLVSQGVTVIAHELWHSLDGQTGALTRSSIEFQGGDLSDMTGRHCSLIHAETTQDGTLIAAALQDHYLASTYFAENQQTRKELPA